MKDVWVMQKCAEILQNASKTYDYATKTAGGLADLMCNDRDYFKEMMKVVVGLPSLIRQQVETKIKEVEEQKEEVQNRTELMAMKIVDQLMITSILLRFKEDWENPQFEVTKYLTAIFEFWLRKRMFPGKRPDIHNMAVKFQCSHTQLQKYVHGHQEPPRVEQTILIPENAPKRKRKVMFLEDVDKYMYTENVTPKKKLKVRKTKLHKRLGIAWL